MPRGASQPLRVLPSSSRDVAPGYRVHIKITVARGGMASGKLEAGIKKQEHIRISVGGKAIGKMELGELLDAHSKTISDGKQEARLRMLRKLTSAKPEGGEWRLVAARHRDGRTNDKMQRDETAKVGDKLPSNYIWCFCNDSATTLTSKRARELLME